MARQLGTSIPISIGTAMAFESIFNHSADEAQVNKVKHTTRLMINVGTLFRNCIEAHRNDDNYTAQSLATLIGQEMELIEELVKKEMARKPEPFFYYATHDSFQKQYPYALWREKTSERQMARKEIHDETLDILVRQHGVVTSEYSKMSFNFDRYASGILITHLAHELLRFTDFPDLSLVESHTGVFKNRTAWYTKLSDSKSLPPIPFSIFTLSVCGDANIFKPQPKARELLIRIAKLDRWRGDSTPKSVRESIGRYRAGHGEDKSLLTKLMNME
jgi:hypothetical protein